MRRWSDVQAMISEPAIDKRTEEKMFSGTLAPEDAPPGFSRVAVLLRAAALPRTQAPSGSLVTDTEKLRQQHVVAAMAAVIAAAPEGLPAAAPGHFFWKAMSPLRPQRAGGRRRGRARLVLVMALGLMVLTAGMAFAGVLPSPVQHAASALFSKVGVHVPHGHGHEGTGSGGEPGSPSGHDKVTGSGDHGKGTDHGEHTGQKKNDNRGKHTGQDKGHHEGDGHGGGGSHEGDGHHGDGGHEGGGHEGDGHGGDGHGGSGSGARGSGGHGGGMGGSGSGDGGDGGGHDGGSGHDGGGFGHDVLTPSSM